MYFIVYMRINIGKLLGESTAHLEMDLSEDVLDTKTLQRLALTSEVYRNFAMGDLPGFKEDFVRGYQSVAEKYRARYGNQQTSDQNSPLESTDTPPSNLDLG